MTIQVASERDAKVRSAMRRSMWRNSWWISIAVNIEMLGECWLLAGFFKFANVASIEVLGGFWFLPGFLKSSISLQLCHVQKANLEVSLPLLLNFFLQMRGRLIFLPDMLCKVMQNLCENLTVR